MTVLRLDDHRLVAELRCAAQQAEELLQAARAIESCVSALNPGSPANSILETCLLVRAAALQVAGLVHGMVGRSERLALLVCDAASSRRDQQSSEE